MRNFVFISPHFPDSFVRFVKALKKNGFRVLGIGDCPYFDLSQELRDNLDEYYLCYDMDNFENEVNAVRYFENKYGHIDYIESNNEYWLEKDAKLREIFHVNTGPRGNEIAFYQHKSLMKSRYEKAGAKVAKWMLIDKDTNIEAIEAFIEKYQYPVFAKPDMGVGAEGDYKIENAADLENFYNNRNKNVTYIMEQFVTGNIISYDGICDENGNVVFSASNFFPPSISDVVKEHQDVFYYTLPFVPKDLDRIGRKVIKAFEVSKRFFHLEFFRLTKDIVGLGKKNSIVALETNMRPAGGYTPDLIDFANSVDCYQIYADVIAFNESRQRDIYPHYFAACASRRDEHHYVHSEQEILEKYKNNVCAYGRYAKVFSRAMGDIYYMAKFNNIEEMNEFKDFVGERN